MQPLYQIAEQYRAALTDLENLDLPAEAIADTLEGMKGELEVKAVNVAAFIGNIEAMAAARLEAAKAMQQRAKAEKARADSLRDYLRHNMEASGISSIDCPEYSLKIKQCPPAVVIDSEATLPDEFMLPPKSPEPDKTKLKAALKEGRQIDGVTLKQSTRLEIK